MKNLLSGLLLLLIQPLVAGASYDMVNFWSTPHEAPAWFSSDNYGGFYGETTGGQTFSQKPVINDSEVRLHKFMIGTAYFYVSDRGPIMALDDLKAVSIYLALV